MIGLIGNCENLLTIYINICKFITKGADVKKRELEQKLKELGFYLQRQGGNHEVWTNGKISIPIPRHNEIKEPTAKSIIKQAQGK